MVVLGTMGNAKAPRRRTQPAAEATMRLEIRRRDGTGAEAGSEMTPETATGSKRYQRRLPKRSRFQHFQSNRWLSRQRTSSKKKRVYSYTIEIQCQQVCARMASDEPGEEIHSADGDCPYAGWSRRTRGLMPGEAAALPPAGHRHRLRCREIRSGAIADNGFRYPAARPERRG